MLTFRQDDVPDIRVSLQMESSVLPEAGFFLQVPYFYAIITLILRLLIVNCPFHNRRVLV